MTNVRLLNKNQLKAILRISSESQHFEHDDEFLNYYLKNCLSTFNFSILRKDEDNYTITDIELFVDSLKCLINLSSEQNSILFLLDFIKSNKLQTVQHLIYFGYECVHYQELVRSLILNLTRSHIFANYFIQVVDAKKFLEFINRNIEDSLNHMILLNLTSCKELINCLVTQETNVLKSIVSSSLSKPESKKFAYSLLRNCCFHEDYFLYLLSDDSVLNTLLLPLCTKVSVIDCEDRLKLPVQISSSLGTDSATTEIDTFILELILDSLFLICSTSSGRDLLRMKGVYFVLRDFHNFSAKMELDLSSDTSSDWTKVTQLTENIVDQLICEENERPKHLIEKSLWSIDPSIECENKL